VLEEVRRRTGTGGGRPWPKRTRRSAASHRLRLQRQRVKRHSHYLGTPSSPADCGGTRSFSFFAAKAAGSRAATPSYSCGEAKWGLHASDELAAIRPVHNHPSAAQSFAQPKCPASQIALRRDRDAGQQLRRIRSSHASPLPVPELGFSAGMCAVPQLAIAVSAIPQCAIADTAIARHAAFPNCMGGGNSSEELLDGAALHRHNMTTDAGNPGANRQGRLRTLLEETIRPWQGNR